MTGRRSGALYSPRLLALAVELADRPFDGTAAAVGEARSRTCGSTIALSSARTDRLERIGLRVSACAVGQASAAIFASAGEGADVDGLAAATAALEAWLAGSGPMPDWPRMEALSPALPHQARHDAILLPWRAALDALSLASVAR